MKYNTVLFDLDGTLTDSGEGIINCAWFALDAFGIPRPPREAMRKFVGPPLWDTFEEFGVPADKTDEAVRIFRSRYIPIGKFENTPYSSIRELLASLRERGLHLFVATSKPESTSIEILQHFNLDGFFDRICGADLDRSRTTKSQVIAYLLENAGSPEGMVMVGDTAFDVLGAAEHGIPTIGVTWGYGNRADILAASPVALADTPEELFRMLTRDA